MVMATNSTRWNSKYASGLDGNLPGYKYSSMAYTGSWATDSQAVRMKVFTVHTEAGNQRLIVNQNGAAASGRFDH